MKYILTKIYLVIFFTFIASQVYCQLDSYNFVDEGAIFKFEPRYVSVKTLDVSQDSVKNPSGFTIRLFSIDHVTFDQGGYQDSHRFSFITEAFSSMIIEVIKGGAFESFFQNSSTEFSGFIAGWHNHVINVIGNDHYNVALGAFWGDYFLSYSPHSQGSYGTAREPGGWYGSLGPAVMLDFDVVGAVNIHFEGSYGFSSKFSDAKDMEFDRDYPKPHFINLGLQLRTNTPFYGGFEHIRTVNRGDHDFNATRSDFYVGVWF